MSQDDEIRNPVEEYMQYIMDQDKQEKPPETTIGPAGHLEIKGEENNYSQTEGGNRNEALKVSDAIKQSLNNKVNPRQEEEQDNNDQPNNSQEESLIFNVKHHPIGLILIFVAIISSYAVVFSFISFLLPGFANIIGVQLGSIGPIVGMVMLTAFLIGLIFLFFQARGYMLNRLILTESSVIHVLHSGLSDRQISELSIEEIKDIIIKKTGLLPALFNYGTIVIETPEGQDDLIFKYAPSPDMYAKAMHNLRLEYLANLNVNP